MPPMPPPPPPPTPREIVDLIERGPKAAECAALWAWVFEPPPGPRPDPVTQPAQASVWDVKTRRAGRLHPDAGHALSLLLGIDRKAIQAAKRWALEESRK